MHVSSVAASLFVACFFALVSPTMMSLGTPTHARLRR